MGKQKHEKPAANLDRSDPAGAAGGTENLAAAGAAGAVPEKPADAVSATAPAGGDQPAAQPAGADTGAAVAGAAVAAGPQEAEKEVGGNGKEAGADGAIDADRGAPGTDHPRGPAPQDAAATDVGDPDAADAAGGQDADAAAAAAADSLASDLEIPTMPVAALARHCSGIGRWFVAGGVPIDISDVDFTREEADIMASFVRDNPEAPLLAMYKHLELTLHLPETIPNNADMLALSLFRHACKAGFYFERLEAAEGDDLGRHMDATPAVSWGGATAMDPIKPALQPTGFSPL